MRVRVNRTLDAAERHCGRADAERGGEFLHERRDLVSCDGRKSAGARVEGIGAIVPVCAVVAINEAAKLAVTVEAAGSGDIFFFRRTVTP